MANAGAYTVLHGVALRTLVDGMLFSAGWRGSSHLGTFMFANKNPTRASLWQQIPPLGHLRHGSENTSRWNPTCTQGGDRAICRFAKGAGIPEQCIRVLPSTNFGTQVGSLPYWKFSNDDLNRHFIHPFRQTKIWTCEVLDQFMGTLERCWRDAYYA